VIPYETTAEAIERIEYFLAHEDERARIARAGCLRAVREYKTEDTFKRLFAALDRHAPASSPAGTGTAS
jgi:spore maturation protein CgeB